MLFGKTTKIEIKELKDKIVLYKKIVKQFSVYDIIYNKIITAEVSIDKTIYFLHDILNKDINNITRIIDNKLDYFNNEIMFIDYISVTNKINIKNIKNKLYTVLHFIECLIELYYNTINNKKVNSKILHLYIINMVNSFDILNKHRS